MKILITSAASQLAQRLAAALSEHHRVRLTDMMPVETEFEFVRCQLGHEEETDALVADMEAVIHVAELPSSVLAESAQPESRIIDFQTRCTYNLFNAAADAGIGQAIYTSTLRLFEQHDEDWTVTESWRPAPTTDADVLAKHLGEFTVREFARERRINVTLLRLGTLVTAADAASQPLDTSWLEIEDAVQAFSGALEAPAKPWAVYHVQSDFPRSRFLIDRARGDLSFEPRFQPAGGGN